MPKKEKFYFIYVIEIYFSAFYSKGKERMKGKKLT